MIILSDFTTSIIKAFDEIDCHWREYSGLVIAGSHNPRDTEMMILKIREARESGIPFYGECFGHQLACIDWAKIMMGIKDATSEEFGKGTFVIVKLPELNVGFKNGESYWNNYGVLKYVEDNYNLYKPPNMFSAQYHASYQSSLGNPHPLISNFLEYAKKASIL